MNNPFHYQPHPLCRLAARRVMAYLARQPQWQAELEAGKMLGVLVCRKADGQLCFLAAYSGQLGGRQDWPWFVPPAFDYLQPDGHFRQEEAAISAINRRIQALQSAEEYQAARAAVSRVAAQGQQAVEAFRQLMAQARALRHEQRAHAHPGEALLAQLERESQFQKAELRRLKQQWAQRQQQAQAVLAPLDATLQALRHERRQRSDALQSWLFHHFVLVNHLGQRRSLASLFAGTPQGVPPSGAGECCAPKLLHHAFTHGLQPLQLAEFWYGRSPAAQVRHHGQFYPACRGKCKPILQWMLGLSDSDADLTPVPAAAPVVRYQDPSLVVVDKPAGLLSVPGRGAAPSVQQWLQQQGLTPYMVHRLDQDTSGLLVVALTPQAQRHLQQQFATRQVEKRYEALVQGTVTPAEGTITLPLSPDLADRPRQVVDPVHGKPATTRYRVLQQQGALTRLSLTPLTGRTHQLRVHCASQQGLGAPIVGDHLYGLSPSPRRAFTLPGGLPQRLCLHAARLAFTHPENGRTLSFESPCPF